MAVEQIQGSAGAIRQPGFEPVPLTVLNQPVERADLVVVFQDDRQQVATGLGGLELQNDDL